MHSKQQNNQWEIHEYIDLLNFEMFECIHCLLNFVFLNTLLNIILISISYVDLNIVLISILF